MNTNRAGLQTVSGERIAQRKSVTVNRVCNTSAPVSFEASLRSSTLPIPIRKKVWNSNKRVSGPRGDGPAYSTFKPPKKVTILPVKQPCTSAKCMKTPATPHSDVEVTAQCFPATGITIQTMHSLKDLVDNFVQNLLKGTGKFDASRLESVRQMFATITKDQVHTIKISPPHHQNHPNAPPGQSRPGPGGTAPSDSLYQSMLWCLIFQASIDLLSKDNTECSVNRLLEGAWDYLENLREFFIPFLRSKEEANRSLMAQLNQNQSNVHGDGESRGLSTHNHSNHRQNHNQDHNHSHIGHHRHDTESTSDTSSTDDEEEAELSSSSSSSTRHQIPRSTKPRLYEHSGGRGDNHCCIPHNLATHSHHQQQQKTKHVDAATATATITKTARNIKIGTDNCAVIRAQNSISVQTPQEVVDVVCSTPMAQSPPTPLLDQYKVARRELAHEADRYLALFRQCQHLQDKLKSEKLKMARLRVGNGCEITPISVSDLSDLVTQSCVIVEKSRTFFRVFQQPLPEHFVHTPLDSTTQIDQTEHCLPRITLEDLPYKVAKLRQEAICMLPAEIPLLSLLDLQWFSAQSKRSDSSSTEEKKRIWKEGFFRVLPFKCRKQPQRRSVSSRPHPTLPLRLGF